MRRQNFIIGTALIVLLAIGCSKHSSQPSSAAPAVERDLGALELTEDVPQYFSLGDKKGCRLVGKQVSDGILIKIAVAITNADGIVTSSQSELTTAPGRPCSVVMGETMISLTPTLKKP